MKLYLDSTQNRNWTYSPDELNQTRQRINAESIQSVQTHQHLSQLYSQSQSIDLDLESSIQLPSLTQEQIQNQFITWQEQVLFCRFWESKILSYCKVFKLDWTVQATAIMLFKRFYLKHTIMDYNPRIYLITCLFLACKIENCTLSLKEYLAKIPNGPTPERMIELEFILATGVGFEFQIHHPYLPMHGFFLDLQAFYSSDSRKQELYKSFLNARMNAMDWITKSLQTDLPLLFSPSQIGRACLYVSCRSLQLEKEILEYISYTFRSETPEKVMGLKDRIYEIIRQIESFEMVDKGIAKDVDTKLNQCTNPRYDLDSPLYQFIKEKQEETHQKNKMTIHS